MIKKYFKLLFPLFDHLYIFQNLEYEITPFLRWFMNHPFDRNLQKKHSLDWTAKTIMLAAISMCLILFLSVLTGIIVFQSLNLYLLFGLLFYYSFFSPLVISLAQIFLTPLQVYQQKKILTAASKKLASHPNLKVVAITGSYAKTSTKNILYTLLWKDFRVVKTPKSYNNPLSVARTVITDIKTNTDIFIAEIGAYKIGDIAKMTKFLNPNIGVITAVAPQHLERFGSLENIAQAKFELASGLTKSGLAILNCESEHLVRLSPLAQCRVIFYGEAANGNKPAFYATGVEVSASGTSFLLHTPKGHSLIVIPLIGEHHVKNFLAAASVALELGLTLNQIRERAKLLLPTPHRLEIRKEGRLTVIDNSYNTNPESSKTSFKVLKQYPGKQKFIVTPGLIELGEQSSIQNKQFAREAAKVADTVIIVGNSFKQDLETGLDEAKFPKSRTLFAKDTNEGMGLVMQKAGEDSVVLIENDLPDQYS